MSTSDRATITWHELLVNFQHAFPVMLQEMRNLVNIGKDQYPDDVLLRSIRLVEGIQEFRDAFTPQRDDSCRKIAIVMRQILNQFFKCYEKPGKKPDDALATLVEAHQKIETSDLFPETEEECLLIEDALEHGTADQLSKVDKEKLLKLFHSLNAEKEGFIDTSKGMVVTSELLDSWAQVLSTCDQIAPELMATVETILAQDNLATSNNDGQIGAPTASKKTGGADKSESPLSTQITFTQLVREHMRASGMSHQTAYKDIRSAIRQRILRPLNLEGSKPKNIVFDLLQAKGWIEVYIRPKSERRAARMDYDDID